MKQQIGPYEIDTYTRAEASQDIAAIGHQFSAQLREQYRGVKLLKMPIVIGTASGASLTLGGQGQAVSGSQCGPDSGYFWRVGRVTVTSSGADVGAVSLYAGSDPNSATPQFLVDNTLKVGQAYYPGSRGLFLFPNEMLYVVIASTSGNVYRLTGLAVEVPAEMAPKIVGGGG